MKVVLLDGRGLSVAEVEAVALHGSRVRVAESALERVAGLRRRLEERMSRGDVIYGVNTGFGSLARERISAGQLGELQRNLVRSHAAGIGEALPEGLVRGMMLLLAASLARGQSGVRPVVVERVCAMLNAGVTPVVPEVGSVGASGDLAPLAHVALVLIGEGEARFKGEVLGGGEAMRRAGVEPLALEAKEGLALINGTHLMAARGALLCGEFERLFGAALVAATMSIDACRASDTYLDGRVYAIRNQPGPSLVAERMRGLLAGSEIVPSHREFDPRVQDPYSLRCVAAVLGASWDAFDYVKRAVERELGAVTDNPLVFDNGDVISAGNFHGMPVAIPLDVLAVAVSHVAGISERRVYFMLEAEDPEMQLAPYLSPQPGLHSGLMIAQYTAAACCNEIAGLCMPASVMNVPTSAGIEDYNSFGPRCAAKAARALELARRVVAIELICAAEGLDAHRPMKSGAGVEAAFAKVRGLVRRFTADRPPGVDIERVAMAVGEGVFGTIASRRSGDVER